MRLTILLDIETPCGGFSFIFLSIQWFQFTWLLLTWFYFYYFNMIQFINNYNYTHFVCVCVRARVINGILVSHWDKHLSYHLVWININFIFSIDKTFFLFISLTYAFSFSFSLSLDGWLARSLYVKFNTMQREKIHLIWFWCLFWAEKQTDSTKFEYLWSNEYSW